MTEIAQAGALELAAQIRSGTLSAVELLDWQQARIDQHQPQLQAFAERFRRRSLRHARRVDAAVARGQPLPGALAGVPFAIKDLDLVAFAGTRAGSRAYRYGWSPVDAPAVKLLRRTGATLVGKTTTSELGLMPVVETDLQPPTVNPWNPAFSAGGSSGGAAAAVAMGGLLSVAHASDGGGSIRIPAAFCHLYGYKASRGLMPDFYGRLDEMKMAVMGAVAHRVEDCIAVVDALCGRPQAGQPGSLLALSQTPLPAGLKIRVCLRSNVAEVHPDIAAGVRAVARLLADMGHHLDEIEPPSGDIDEFLPIYQRLSSRAFSPSEAAMQPITRWLREGGRQVSAQQASDLARSFQDRVLTWFGDADFMLSPTTPGFAPKVGAYTDLDPRAGFLAAAQIGAFTAAINTSGQPAASLPGGLGGPDQLPFGVHLVGKPGADLDLLRLSRSLEEAMAWTQRRSPVFLA